MDHAAIYLFIAGSATFTLGAMTGWSGWAGIATCALLWLLALAGATALS